LSARRSLELARLALLFVFGAAVALHFGRRGFMPLDQSICFDGGWRVLSGQVPFRDYTAPNGFTVHALQALFFAIFGISWFAYCLHAAVINGLFVVLVERLLALLGLERWAAGTFALCSAFLLYPPFGVPYMDPHAFFFSLAALVAAIASVNDENARAQRRYALAIGPLLALAYLSKQIPSIFFVPAVLAVPLFAGSCLKKLYQWYALSLIATAAVGVIVALALRIDWALVDTYWRRLPTEEGARRLGYVPSASAVFTRFVQTLQQWPLRSPWMAVCIGVPCALTALVVALRRRDAAWRRPLGAALCALFLLLAGLAFVALTSNQKELGVPLVFASAGAAMASVTGLAELATQRFPRAPAFVRGFVALFALLAVDDTIRFTREVVSTRVVDDVKFDVAVADAAAAELPSALAYLRWSVPRSVAYSPRELRELADYLRARDGNFWLLGDTSVLYGITGKRSIAPSLWFHPGLTLPSPLDAEFARYEQALVEHIQGGDVRTLVIEGEHTWIGYQLNPGERPPKAGYLTLAAFPRVAALVAERKVAERTFGAFRVIELAPH
jgi:hypothetical protein